MMREIKFRAWDNAGNMWHDVATFQNEPYVWNYEETSLVPLFSDLQVKMNGNPILMQFTGLKDKNGLQYIYEGDIIGVDGTVKGNKYENESLLQDKTNLIIEGFGTKSWWATYKEAVARRCQDSE
jgi:uncharacterized phage protein (TIGR01671 family)